MHELRQVLKLFMLFIPVTGISAESAPPNIVIFLIDDMGHGDIAAHGNPVISTPNLDRLHDDAVRFTNFSVSPTCSPTRAALLTGRHEFLVNVTGTVRGANELDLEATTIAQLFRNNGYATGIFGKWHLGLQDGHEPGARGFDVTLHVPGDRQNSHFDPVMSYNGRERKFTGYREDNLFTEAMRFMEENRNRPFFCYLPTYSAHGANIAPDKFVEPYKYLLTSGISKNKDLPGHYGQIANLDYNLGRLMTYLEESGLDENTLLVALNDNGSTQGAMIFNSGMRGEKGTVWRGGTRAFSFWKLGDSYPPGDRNQMVGHIDLFPTLAELCGLEIPDKLQSRLEGDSLLPVLKDPRAELPSGRMQIHHRGRWDDLHSWPDHRYALAEVRWGDYSLIRVEPCKDDTCKNCSKVLKRGKAGTNQGNFELTQPGQWELYDLQTDPHQDKDIASKHPGIVASMSNRYDKWWEAVAKQMEKKLN